MLRQLERQQFRCIAVFSLGFLTGVAAADLWVPYRSSALVLVDSPQPLGTGWKSAADLLAAQEQSNRQIVRYAVSADMHRRVAAEPSNQVPLFRLEAVPLPETNLIRIEVTTPTPAGAASLANRAAEELVAYQSATAMRADREEVLRLQSEAGTAAENYAELAIRAGARSLDPRLRREADVAADAALRQRIAAQRELERLDTKATSCFGGCAVVETASPERIVRALDRRLSLAGALLVALLAGVATARLSESRGRSG